MRKSITATLLSALVFPGAGHLYLRSYLRGCILLAIAAATLVDFIRRAWHEAELIREQFIDQINSGGIIDLDLLVAKTMNTVDHIDSQPFTIATLVLLACWLIGIIDSHRLGKKIEETSTTS